MKLKKTPECPTGINIKLQFEQKPWLKEYIQLNTDKRTVATSYLKKIIGNCWIRHSLVRQWKILERGKI